MAETIKNRSEIIFIYDVNDGNPNGDPLDENKPRIDEDVGINLVTDVRLKRTIRDYLHDFKELEIFVREIITDEEKGYIQDAKERARDFDENAKRILAECIDMRLFGGVIPIEKSQGDKSAITYTGPVQFKMGRSLHRVTVKHIRGTGAFASGAKSKQKTFREEDFLPYSLILFYGIVNENAAKQTGLTDEDGRLLLEGIWNGTKSLITRTKVGQVPRLLLKVNYSKENYHIGDLDKLVKLVTDMLHEDIRDVEDFKLDISELIKKLKDEKDAIKDIEVKADDRIKFKKDDVDFSVADLHKETGIIINPISF
ncbi:type I-B CRISPR-associated protein Cas7/Csh2 [Methanothrix soehngenii]|jgi:CRISPR-associated protein Csh2|uniref:type I-B CRISPR-associated protein Cas7/Csh2 n=1 Tax=Methanothrix soehngenii TaxID=2223 RepID=UPI002FE30273